MSKDRPNRVVRLNNGAWGIATYKPSKATVRISYINAKGVHTTSTVSESSQTLDFIGFTYLPPDVAVLNRKPAFLWSHSDKPFAADLRWVIVGAINDDDALEDQVDWAARVGAVLFAKYTLRSRVITRIANRLRNAGCEVVYA